MALLVLDLCIAFPHSLTFQNYPELTSLQLVEIVPQCATMPATPPTGYFSALYQLPCRPLENLHAILVSFLINSVCDVESK